VVERRQWQLDQDVLDFHHDPNAVISPVHDRMPVILDPDSYDLWLDPGVTNLAPASELLNSYDAWLMGLMTMRNAPHLWKLLRVTSGSLRL
jgi:hypothetical protein